MEVGFFKPGGFPRIGDDAWGNAVHQEHWWSSYRSGGVDWVAGRGAGITGSHTKACVVEIRRC